jgi:hypothetical protein
VSYGVLAYYDGEGKFHTVLTLTAERHCELLLGIIFSSDGCRLVREVVFERSA